MHRLTRTVFLLVAAPVLGADVSVNVDVGHGGVAVDVVVTENLGPVLAAMESARIALPEAIAIAAGGGEGRAQAIDAELKLRGGVPTYEIELVAERGRKEVRVDGVSGRVLRAKDEDADDDDRILRSVRMPLAEAIARASREVGGRAYEAELEIRDDRPRFEVHLLAGPQVARVLIDAESGQVTSVRRSAGPVGAWYFDAAAAETLPSGWVARQTHAGKSPATWQVVADPEAPTPPHVLRLVKTENNGSTYNLLVSERPRVRDVDLRVMVRADSGKEDQGGGLVWRYRDENNYYICRLNPLESNYRVYKVADGKRTQLASADVEAEAGKWYELRAMMTDSAITCSVNGKPLLEARDTTFTEPGAIGLWTKADAATSFDNLLVLTPASQPAPPQ